MARLKIFKLEITTKCFHLFLSIGMSYYQEGCNISELIKSECSLVDPSEI
jgi:hypothetical protein